MKKLRKMFQSTVAFVRQQFLKFQSFWQRQIQPFLDRFFYRIRHNRIYREDGNTVRLLSIINIKITRKRRHAFYGYLFIFLYILHN